MVSWRSRPWLWPLLFLAWVVVSEGLVFALGGDFGGMSFALLHFAVNPFFALVVGFFTVATLRRQSWLQRTASLVGVALIFMIGYLGASGNTWLFEVLRLRMRG
jgi:hypothetical protein